MAFPTTPTNGQLATVNGVSYTYNSAVNSWTRAQATLPSLSINIDTFVGNGTTLTYVLGVTPVSKEFITVNIDGILQQKTAYNLSNNALTLTGTPINGAVIEVKTISSSPASVITGLVFDSFTGDGSTLTYSLSTTPTNKNFTLVTIGGVVQQKTNYSVSADTLEFTTAPPLSAPIEVITFGPAITSTIAGGSNTQIQFNNSGVLGGSSTLTFNNSSNTLTTTNLTSTNLTSANITSTNVVAETLTVNNKSVATTGKSIAMSIVFGG